jgi:hypothetical protein
MNAYQKLLAHWASYKPGSGNLHPADEIPYLRYKLKKFDGNPNRKIHTDYPQPFYGNIKNASLYFLMLNPAYDDIEVPVDTKAIQNAWKKQYNQTESRYPFLPFNPDLYPNGHRYWYNRKTKNGKFAPVIRALEHKGYSPDEAFAWIGKNVCDLELFPYRSNNTGMSKEERILLPCGVPSVKLITDFAREIAKDKSKLIIVLRAASAWDLSGSNVINYPETTRHAQNPSLKSNFAGKESVIELIMKHLIKNKLV